MLLLARYQQPAATQLTQLVDGLGGVTATYDLPLALAPPYDTETVGALGDATAIVSTATPQPPHTAHRYTGSQ